VTTAAAFLMYKIVTKRVLEQKPGYTPSGGGGGVWRPGDDGPKLAPPDDPRNATCRSVIIGQQKEADGQYHTVAIYSAEAGKNPDPVWTPERGITWAADLYNKNQKPSRTLAYDARYGCQSAWQERILPDTEPKGQNLPDVAPVGCPALCPGGPVGNIYLPPPAKHNFSSQVLPWRYGLK